MRQESDVRLALSVFFILFSVYLLTASRTLHFDADEGFVFASVENIAKFGRFDVEQMASVSKSNPWEFGVDGKHYSRYGLMQSLLPVPLYMIAVRLPDVGNADLVLLFNSIVTALTGVVVLLAGRTLGYSVTTSVTASIVFAFGTIAWPYSKRLLGEPGSSLLLLTSVCLLLRFERDRRSVHLLLAGALLGTAFAYKASNGILLLAELAFLAYVVRAKRERLASALTLLLPFAVFVALAGLYNHVRFGSPWSTGYGPQEGFTTPLLHGLWGLLWSPGRSFFLYSPILAVSLVGLVFFTRKHRAATILLGSAVILQLLLYAKWWNWWGGLSWGSRLLVPSAPLLALWLLPVIDRARTSGRSAAIALVATFVISLVVQIQGVAVDRSVEGWLTSPLLDQPGCLDIACLDFIWVHNDQGSSEIDYASLALMIGLIILAGGTGFTGAKGWNRWMHTAMLGFVALVVMAVIYVSLARAYGHAPSDYKALIAEIDGATSSAHRDVGFVIKPPDAVIFSDFLRNDQFLNLNKSSAFVLGWGEESPLSPRLAHRLDDVTRRLAVPAPGIGVVVHVTPNETGSPANGIERFLKERFFVSETRWFGNTRLVRYLIPRTEIEDVETIQTAAEENLAGLVNLQRSRVFRPAPEEDPENYLSLFVTLEWEPLAPIAKSYTVFVQLLSQEGELVAQRDEIPIGGMMPTSSWVPGRIVLDNHVLFLPPGLPLGKYTLVTGMYELSEGKRLPVIGPTGDTMGDFLSLATMEIQ